MQGMSGQVSLHGEANPVNMYIRLGFSLRLIEPTPRRAELRGVKLEKCRHSEMIRYAQRWLGLEFGDMGKSKVVFFDIQTNTNDSSF